MGARPLDALVASGLDPHRLTTPAGSSPDVSLRRADLSDALLRERLDSADRLPLALQFENERPPREIAAALRPPTSSRSVDARLDMMSVEHEHDGTTALETKTRT